MRVKQDFVQSSAGAAPVRPDAVSGRPTLVCFSHLRWNFVFQRPQHLMVRFAETMNVIYWEEPVEDGCGEPHLAVSTDPRGVQIATPHVPQGCSPAERDLHLRAMLNRLLAQEGGELVRWYYTPMMLSFSRHLNAAATIYDCMDELSAFKFAPPELVERERELFGLADAVFTGGYSLYEAKTSQHHTVHAFPSSVDVAHFRQARSVAAPSEPVIGFYGVIDERFDLDLIDAVAALRPGVRFEIAGPVVKIDPADLPQRPNITYLGSRDYAELPALLGSWTAAMMPFALNESTRFISPTKTPEYLAGGRALVSTPIRDVERTYGALNGVRIARTADEFAAACDDILALAANPDSWLPQADAMLADNSWEATQGAMAAIVEECVVRNRSARQLVHLDRSHFDVLIVGAGFAGSVMAERLAADAGKRVLIIDKRPHIGGNAYDHRDAAGLLIHRYGPHIFHTNSGDIFAYLSRFTEWRDYEHRVLAEVRGQQVPIPINRTTLEKLYGVEFNDESEVAQFLADRAEPVDEVRTSEDVVVGTVGRELYELFFRGYTRKQWALDPSELDKSVTARIPTRTNDDDRYFTDSFQGMPRDGYTAMFEKMLDHPLITVLPGVEFEQVRDAISYDRLVWTGPIDEYFGHCHGKLPYRSLEFVHKTIDQESYQDVGTVNYPDEAVPFTRITEFKHLTGDVSDRTSIVFEYPRAEGDPYYPIPKPENAALFKRYEELARGDDTIFVGRLATYRYYNMDQIVGQALATYRRLDLTAGKSGAASKAGPVSALAG
jgi:UDP-galactopyranose mutase